MGAFQWIMKKITKVFSRSTNALFYITLYREILNEIQEITKDEEKSLQILREIGKKAANESCERHSSIFKFMPGNPKKVLDYFGVLWSVVFGIDLGEHSYEEIPREGAIFNDYILNIKKCPICGGYGEDPEDKFDFKKIPKGSEGFACGLCGMLESVANFILKLKKNDYRIEIIEQKCMAKGEDCLQFICRTHNLKEWREIVSSRGQEDLLEEEFIQEGEPDLFDKLQDYISLDKLEEMLDAPLENIKNRIADIIRDKLNMEPSHFFDYFRNYEDDMIRIIGFLAVHLFNEYGGLVEKFTQSEIFAKITGYIFKHLKEMTLLFIPLDVINDYHELLIAFLDGLAPKEMVNNIREFSGKDDLNYIFEGAQMALENLGIDFSELKENIWEELRKEREDGLISAEPSMIDKSQERFPKFINIIQEILMLINEILTLPIRIIISESHYGLKTAINSVVNEEEGLFGSIKAHADNIFDYIQEIRK
ncbi:MAG: hypothetical protein ACTSQJ_17045 [Promethearchaeota archaeon]